MSNSAESNSGSDGRWLRKAGDGMLFFEAAQSHASVITVYWLTVSTATPLDHAHISTALAHLYRKVPGLRLCLRPREDNGPLWECEMDTEQLDFQVLEGADPQAVMEDLMHQTFPSATGPLWRARLVPGAQGEPCPMEELQAAFPHTNHLLLANHHGIADGTSNTRTYNLLLAILNDVIAGTDIDDDEQLGELVGEEEFKKIINARKDELEKDPDALQRLLEEKMDAMEKVPLLLQCFPPPDNPEPKIRTEILTEDLDEGTTQKFVARCKQEGVTVGSAFTAIVNGTMVDRAVQVGLTKDEYVLNEVHAVDLRRYLPGDAASNLGVNITVCNNSVTTPATWRHDFWGYARTVHESLHQKLREGGPVTDECLGYMMMPDEPMEAMFSTVPPPSEDSMLSNMGCLDAIFPNAATGKHAQITRIMRGSTNFSAFASHLYQTFRGRFLYCLAFSSHIIAKDTAQDLLQDIFHNLRSLV